MTRTTLAAVTLPDNHQTLALWISNPQSVKPGNRMPAIPLSGADLALLRSYLESLQ